MRTERFKYITWGPDRPPEFYDLLEDHTEIMRGIIHVLSRWVRNRPANR